MCESSMCRVSELYQNAPCYCMFYNVSWIEPAFWRLGGFLLVLPVLGIYQAVQGQRVDRVVPSSSRLPTFYGFDPACEKHVHKCVPIFRYLLLHHRPSPFEVHFKKKVSGKSIGRRWVAVCATLKLFNRM